jgi:ABC-type uncharacterized transport system YnjBCD substrate-binding protein
MGSSEKYWCYARECVKYARRAENKADHDVALHTAQAWMNVARADHDVAQQAPAELPEKPQFHLDIITEVSV